jgi:hypothetical protein
VVIDWHSNQLTPIKETKMFKNRFLLILAAISLMTVTVAISRPLSNAPASTQPASSSIGSPAFYEYRQGEWSVNVSGTTPLDECFDVSLWEVASCRKAQQK